LRWSNQGSPRLAVVVLVSTEVLINSERVKTHGRRTGSVFERAEKTPLRCPLIGYLCGDIDLVHDENREGTVGTRRLFAALDQILLRSVNAALSVIPVLSVDATS
jgi:hypothetical protein